MRAGSYTMGSLRSDAVAGLSVAVVELPQAMAYALIAGVPPQYGIYASIIQGVLGALLSGSEHVRTGPTNTQSLLIASAVMPLVDSRRDPAVYLQFVFLLTLLKGLLQLAMWMLRAGELVPFVSRSVLVGISAGAGILIVIGQLGPLLGTPPPALAMPGAPGVVVELIGQLSHVNPLAVLIGLAVAACSAFGRSLHPRFPGALVGVAGATLAVALLGWEDRVRIVGPIPNAWPTLILPGSGLDWRTAYGLVPAAAALALLGGIESVAIAKTIASRSGETVRADRELLAQGLTNSVSSFLQCLPGSASFTRSALDYDAGAVTRYAAVFNAAFVGVLFVTFANFARYIPLSALAGVLVVVAVRLVDVGFARRIARADRSDAVVLAATFLAVLMTRLEYAIFIGVFLSVVFFLRVSSRLHVAEVEDLGGGRFVERAPSLPARQGAIIFLQLEGDLFFALAEELGDRLRAARRRGVRAVILRLKRCRSIDGTILDLLDGFARDMRRDGAHLLFCGVRPEVMRTLVAYGLDHQVGPDNVFVAEPGEFAGASKAWGRARTLCGLHDGSHDVALEYDFAYDI